LQSGTIAPAMKNISRWKSFCTNLVEQVSDHLAPFSSDFFPNFQTSSVKMDIYYTIVKMDIYYTMSPFKRTCGTKGD